MAENTSDVTTAVVFVVAAFATLVLGSKKMGNANGSETTNSGGDHDELAAETESSSGAHDGEFATETDSGYWLNVDRDFRVIPTERTCFNCSEEGKVHPLERFRCYPCCGHKVCLVCMAKYSTFCGECITEIPYGEHAYLWMLKHMKSGKCSDKSLEQHLLGRIFIIGTGTYLDELVRMPLYDRLPPPCTLLAMMNPPNVSVGVRHLTAAAEDGVIAAMLDLADAYNTNFHNDLFKKDKGKAEYWFRRALGERNTLFPLAFTRYGLFLKWESRLEEARNMFMVAATHGHARGQYEYAVCLLGGISTDENCVSDEDVTGAIEWLCKASKKGFYAPSYTLLAKILIDIAEKSYGTAYLVGKNPLPRALQILSLADGGGYGDSEHEQNKAIKLSERYGGKLRCSNSNCGAEGTENNPLMACHVCGVSVYCSRICQRRDFRDGHKFDCCSPDRLFDFHMIKLALPWFKRLGWHGEGNVPSLQSPQRRTLMQMVEDDTDEVYGEVELEYDEHILTLHMLRMRKNLEAYLDQQLRKDDGESIVCETRNGGNAADDTRNMNLKKQIDIFAERESHCSVTLDLVKAMHTIRDYGNKMVHRLPEDPAPDQHKGEEAVRLYRQLKEEYEMNVASMHRTLCQDIETKREMKYNDVTPTALNRIALPDSAQSKGEMASQANNTGRRNKKPKRKPERKSKKR